MILSTEELTRAMSDTTYLHTLSVSDIQETIAQHPYFAAPRLLLARRCLMDGRDDAYEEALALAAVYSPNRAWLKEYLESDKQPTTESPIDVESPTKPNAIRESEGTVESPVAEERKSTADLTSEATKADMGRPIITEQEAMVLKTAAEGIQAAAVRNKADIAPEPEEQPELDLTIDRTFEEWLAAVSGSASRQLKAPDTTYSGPEGVPTDWSPGLTESRYGHATETLALLYEKQGKAAMAIKAYGALQLKDPSKSGYFAGKIAALKQHL